ncbi:MAG: hypothetical protein PHV06_00580 [bacterium]|nr:hypothetical protein [bacterium]
MTNEEIEKIVLKYIHQETGFGPELRPRCEFEDLYLIKISEEIDASVLIEFRYDFDEDGFSQYDKTIIFKGELKILPNRTLEEISFYIIHLGVDSKGPRSKRKFEYKEGLF